MAAEAAALVKKAGGVRTGDLNQDDDPGRRKQATKLSRVKWAMDVYRREGYDHDQNESDQDSSMFALEVSPVQLGCLMLANLGY